MKTIEEKEWRDYKGESKGKEEADGPRAMVSDVLLVVANAYVPTEGLILNTAEMRKFNKAVDVLEQPPFTDDDKFWFEDDHFEVLKKVVVYMAPRLLTLARSSGEVEDLFKQEDDG